MLKMFVVNLLHYFFTFKRGYRGYKVFGSWFKQGNSNDLDVLYIFDDSKPIASKAIRYVLDKLSIDASFAAKNSDGRYIFQYHSKEDIVSLELRKNFEVRLAQ